MLFKLEACDQWCATKFSAGSMLFIIYVNELNTNPEGMVSKFADDTKIGGVVDSEKGYLRVQWDLAQMGQWTEEWQMEVNSDK
eukprot:g15612.t1